MQLIILAGTKLYKLFPYKKNSVVHKVLENELR